MPIVTLQYQEDYFPHATGTAIRDFRPLAEAGAVIVNGSQSHVAKAMEFYANGFIHYGLGNLFFDQPEFYITYDSFIQNIISTGAGISAPSCSPSQLKISPSPIYDHRRTSEVLIKHI